MCGLTFIFSRESRQDLLESRTQRALSRLIHRGPDDGGTASGTHWAAGHRRLSIIDVSGSHQPMHNPERTHILVFNGEIYNYKDLRDALDNSWQFRTHGDTEVILAGLLVEGSSFIKKMEGMWGFVLWNEPGRQLLLSRDRFGEKPLYYYFDGQIFACASEIPALLELLGDSPDADPVSVADYLRYGFYAPGRTVYKNIYEVLPGHTVSWTPGTDPVSCRYWELPVTQYTGSKQQAVEEIRHLLTQAVASRMIADVEVGAFLSGGIDSSLIVSILAKDLGLTPKTFCIGFEDRSFDEREYAAMVAHLYKTDHHTDIQVFAPGDLKRIILDHLGQPFADSSILPTALVSRLASGFVKVALSGDGGDELFSGYQRYHARMFMRIATLMPDYARKNFIRLIKMFPEPTSHHSRSYLKKAHLFINNYLDNDASIPYVAPGIISEDELALVLPDAGQNTYFQFPETPRHRDEVMDMMYHDLMTYLPQDILTKVDRATMTCSLESRAPFLDSRLAEFSMSLPRSWHRDIFSGKLFLKNSFREYLPGKIWNRNKQGFAVPLHLWFKGSLGDELRLLINETGKTAICTSRINRMLDEHISGVRDNSLKLWSVFVLFLWKQNLKMEF